MDGRLRTVACERMDAFGFTPRERCVAWELLRGAGNKQIARSMGIRENTVKEHLRVMYQKAYVESRVALVLALLGVEVEAA